MKSIIINISSFTHCNRFLWLNKDLRYKRKQFFLTDFECRDFFHRQLLKTDNDYYSYEKLATNFNFTPNNNSFIGFIKLISAFPLE